MKFRALERFHYCYTEILGAPSLARLCFSAKGGKRCGRYTILGISIAFLAIAVFSIPAIASSASRAHGAQVFAATGCQHCHMIGGVGGHRGPDLSGVGKRCSKAQMRHRIVNGSNIMPSFGEVLQPSELKDLIDYLHSCRKKDKERNISETRAPSL